MIKPEKITMKANDLENNFIIKQKKFDKIPIKW